MSVGEKRKRVLRAGLALRGITITDLARGLGISRTWLDRVVRGDDRSPRVERHLVALVPDIATEAPWPEREAPRGRGK